MSVDYWYVLALVLAIATVATACGIGGATFGELPYSCLSRASAPSLPSLRP